VSRSICLILIRSGRELVDAHTDYAPVPASTPREYVQRTQTASLLSRLAEANKHILSKLTLSTTPDLPISYDPASTLYQFAMLGVSTPDVAWPVFTALWDDLNSGAGGRPPILVAADSISHIFSPSHYKTLDENEKLIPVHSFDLLLPRFFVDLLTGTKPLPSGGIVLGATSRSDFLPCKPLEIGIKLAQARNEAAQSGSSESIDVTRFWNPLEKIDQRVLDQASKLKLLELRGIPTDQARTMIEFWAQNGFVRDVVDPNYVSEKWTLSGGGILGELERNIVSNVLRT
jgi:small subunit ribosomal protein S29